MAPGKARGSGPWPPRPRRRRGRLAGRPVLAAALAAAAIATVIPGQPASHWLRFRQCRPARRPPRRRGLDPVASQAALERLARIPAPEERRLAEAADRPALSRDRRRVSICRKSCRMRIELLGPRGPAEVNDVALSNAAGALPASGSASPRAMRSQARGAVTLSTNKHARIPR